MAIVRKSIIDQFRLPRFRSSAGRIPNLDAGDLVGFVCHEFDIAMGDAISEHPHELLESVGESWPCVVRTSGHPCLTSSGSGVSGMLCI